VGAYWGGAFNGEMKRLMPAHAFRFFDRVIFPIPRTASARVGPRRQSAHS
jgi:hypothetical protein